MLLESRLNVLYIYTLVLRQLFCWIKSHALSQLLDMHDMEPVLSQLILFMFMLRHVQS